MIAYSMSAAATQAIAVRSAPESAFPGRLGLPARGWLTRTVRMSPA